MLKSLRMMLLPLLAALVAALSLAGMPQAQDAPAAPAAVAAPMALPNVMDVRVSATPERARLVIDLAAKTEFALVSLSDPDRLAIDVRAATFSVPEPTGKPAGEGMIAEYVVEQAAPDRVRTMLTLSAPAQVQQAYVLDPFEGQPARLVVDVIPATAEEFAANVARDAAASATPPVADASTPAGGSELPIATRPLVVIDPGHGGIDSGAETTNGIKEKDIVLAFALRLQELLVASGRFDVALTREDDTFLRLEERVALARTNKADLFISVHADSFQQAEIRGASVYTRDENATDVLDKVLADKENKTDVIAGFAMPQMAPEVVDILLDLMRREMRHQSFMAAQAIVHQLEPSVQLRRFPVRQADFFVLQAPDVPSVLLELGFLSNADDMANLLRGEWQDRTADALARGISSYFDGLVPEE
ncbi:MAG: N-acetylmuramoyl-L-alanine amidase [Alphaproteobacteria bacterium]|nr:N-acetylmuramoyl-L-alanine amidase [Alphaproteobacteria bacterium]MBU1560925.1 N-acetylmuramoyl-L-alanine amidase [Alphaproteobacteria bacterium]MBU2304899.1 N-acetylmuramoyl-L-alanine amidase [Alphaproteobacteria bacterium]MBU2370150.1 N-acetylmuramoyl-L-alanine amidase [Alphaproteobacteria bacterium]